MNESKSSRFKRIAEARVDKITKMLRLLGNCSNKSNYEYTDVQVGKIVAKLYSELDKLHTRFVCAAHGKGRFSLSVEHNSDGFEFPSVILPLPDGTRLRASAVNDENFPAINVWLQSVSSEDEKSVCFVEFNGEHDKGKELCIGVCASNSEDPYLYVPFNKDEDGRQK